MPKSTRYVTKLTEISCVVLEGKLGYVYEAYPNPDHLGSWQVIQSATATDDVEEWLEKFDGKHVTITIETHERDESHLLPQASDPQ